MATTNRKMTNNSAVQRMVCLIRKQGRKEKELTNYLGIPPGSMSKWKYDGSLVYIKYIAEICEFLDTTPNYLFFGPEDEEERLSPSGKEMIRTYRSLDDGRKKCIRDTLKYISKSKK